MTRAELVYPGMKPSTTSLLPRDGRGPGFGREAGTGLRSPKIAGSAPVRRSS